MAKKKKKWNETTKTVSMLNGDLNAFVTPVSPTARKYYKLAHGQVTTLMTNKYNLPTDNIYILNKLFSVQYNKFDNSYV